MAVHELFPYLCVPDASAAIEFYTRAFGAEELFRLAEPSGRVGHAELSIGKHVLMLSDGFPEYGIHPAKPGERYPCAMHLHVEDADALFARAIEAGGEVLVEMQDQFYGERSGRLRDPFGFEWILGHSIEEVTPEEMQKRYTAMFE